MMTLKTESYSNMPTIKGSKITLRPFRADDVEAVLIGDDETNRLTGTHNSAFTREQVERYVANFAEDDSRVGWVIADSDSDNLEALGEVIILDIDTNNRSAWIRIAMYGIDKVNRGYGTEAMQLAVAHGFTELKLHRIALEVYAFNPRAIRVYEKVGFQREGILRDALFWDGEYVDAIGMAILEDDWRALNQS